MKSLTVIKIGGGVIDDTVALDGFLDRFAAVAEPKILVHGGGRAASEMSKKLGHETTMIDGRRITDAGTLKVAVMIYAGLINKTIVARLQKRGCNAIGISGADGNAIPAARRPSAPIDFGYVGDVDPAAINTALLGRLLDCGLTPVFCAITHDGGGGLLNTNADTIASSLAIAMSQEYAVRLVFCFEKHGVLCDSADERSIIAALEKTEYETLKAAGVIGGGMTAKLDNAFAALEQGVSEITITHASELGAESGTTIK